MQAINCLRYLGVIKGLCEIEDGRGCGQMFWSHHKWNMIRDMHEREKPYVKRLLCCTVDYGGQHVYFQGLEPCYLTLANVD